MSDKAELYRGQEKVMQLFSELHEKSDRIAELESQLAAEREKVRVLRELVVDAIEDETQFETEWNKSARELVQATAPEQEGGVMPDITKCVNRKCPKCELCYRFTAPASEFWQLYDLFKPNSSGVCTEFVAKHARHNLGGVEP